MFVCDNKHCMNSNMYVVVRIWHQTLNFSMHVCAWMWHYALYSNIRGVEADIRHWSQTHIIASFKPLFFLKKIDETNSYSWCVIDAQFDSSFNVIRTCSYAREGSTKTWANGCLPPHRFTQPPLWVVHTVMLHWYATLLCYTVMPHCYTTLL